MLHPDIVVNLKFLTTEEGGRKTPTPPNFFSCIFDIHGKSHDARMLLENVGAIHPGEDKESVPVKFLCADLVMPKLHDEIKFY